MSLLINRRHSVAFCIAALLLFTAVAPLCLMPASPAMAMSIPGSATQPAQDCDSGTGSDSGSMSACPYMDREEAPPVTSGPDSSLSLVALPGLAAGPVVAGLGDSTLLGFAREPQVLAPITPLRL